MLKKTSKIICLASASAIIFPMSEADELKFNRDIRPILSQNCFQCHGPDSKSRKAGLRLDQFKAAIADQKGVRAIVPGKPESSELIARVFHSDPDEKMPPPEAKLTLSGTQKETLRQWINDVHIMAVKPVPKYLVSVFIPFGFASSTLHFMRLLDWRAIDPDTAGALGGFGES